MAKIDYEQRQRIKMDAANRRWDEAAVFRKTKFYPMVPCLLDRLDKDNVPQSRDGCI